MSAELTIISVDLESRTLVVSRNSHCPVLLAERDAWQVLGEPAEAVGIYERTRPVISELALAAGLTVIAFTDGMMQAGARRGQQMDLLDTLQTLICQPDCDAQAIADGLLAAALSLDENRPADDISVVVLRVVDTLAPVELEIRRMGVSFPIPPV